MDTKRNDCYGTMHDEASSVCVDDLDSGLTFLSFQYPEKMFQWFFIVCCSR